MSIFNKDLVSANLRMLMARFRYSSQELADKAGITKHQVDNILYARAIKKETLNKIAKALNVRTEVLTANDDPTQKQDFDMKRYAEIICFIQKTLENKNIKATKLIIERITNIMYKYYNHFSLPEEGIVGIFLYLLETDPDVILQSEPVEL